MTARNDRYEHLKSRMPPPLPCALGLFLGLLFGWLFPWPIAPYSLSLIVGVLLIAAVVAWSIWMARAFRAHQTPADPARETTAIIDSGPFGLSRNPAYLGAATLQVALGFLFNNLWIVLLTIPAAVAIHYLVVLREEAYLEAKFGKAYLEYKSRVRRWV